MQDKPSIKETYPSLRNKIATLIKLYGKIDSDDLHNLIYILQNNNIDFDVNYILGVFCIFSSDVEYSLMTLSNNNHILHSSEETKILYNINEYYNEVYKDPKIEMKRFLIEYIKNNVNSNELELIAIMYFLKNSDYNRKMIKLKLSTLKNTIFNEYESALEKYDKINNDQRANEFSEKIQREASSELSKKDTLEKYKKPIVGENINEINTKITENLYLTLESFKSQYKEGDKIPYLYFLWKDNVKFLHGCLIEVKFEEGKDITFSCYLGDNNEFIFGPILKVNGILKHYKISNDQKIKELKDKLNDNDQKIKEFKDKINDVEKKIIEEENRLINIEEQIIEEGKKIKEFKDKIYENNKN